MSRPLVELLYFDGCPNQTGALELVERVSRELGLEPELRLVNVPDEETARRLRFLGSPTIRVDGADVDPEALERDEYVLSCRVYRTESGFAGRPDEAWVRAALEQAAADSTEEQAAVEAALGAATIPPQRRGRARTARLGPGERGLYRWLLRRFAEGAPPARAELATAAADFGVEFEQAAAVFAAEDLVHLDPASGAVQVVYPFSGTPRGHRVRIDGGHWVEAMCAIDALGIAAMLARPVEVVSRDPVSGAEVRVQVDRDGADWEPEQAVVLAGSSTGDGPSFRGCCSVLNFFESGEHARQYLLAHPEVSGHPITIPEATAAGAAIFAGLLDEDSSA